MRLPYSHYYQSGAVFITSLLILLVMSLLGLAALRHSQMQSMMTSHLRDQQFAFRAADLTLRTAEQWLEQLTDEPLVSHDGHSGIWHHSAIDPNPRNGIPWWQEPQRQADWWRNQAISAPPLPRYTSPSRSLDPPRYIIEYLGSSQNAANLAIGFHSSQQNIVYYRITARANGITSHAHIMLQSSYAKRF